MNIEELRDYCIVKEDVVEELPFGPDTLVFKVKGKIFALANLEGPLRVNIKCDPERSIILREEFESIIPGYHMNKKHWNTLIMDGSIPVNLVKELIDLSYNLVNQSKKQLRS